VELDNYPISDNTINTAIIGGVNITANSSNSVYVPKLVLVENSDSSAPDGTIRWNGTNFQGYNGSWINLDLPVTVTSISAGVGMNFTTINKCTE
jgi:hypothetical protein